jgi:hypothetical protein
LLKKHYFCNLQSKQESNEEDIPAINPEKEKQTRIQEPYGNRQRAEGPEQPQGKREKQAFRFR